MSFSAKGLFAVVILTLASVTQGYSQFKLVGPTDSKPGNLIVITATEFKGNDIIVDCFPQNSFWTANKNLKGEPQISFATTTEDTYTFVFATNTDSKTFLQTWSVKVGQGKPVPPTPTPNPNPNPNPNPVPGTDLSKRLDPAYMVNPNKDQLAKYLAVFVALKTQVDQDKFTTYKQAWDVLVSATKVALMSDTDLRNLRDEIAKYLVEKTGPQSSKYDKTILSTALNDIVTALNILKSTH